MAAEFVTTIKTNEIPIGGVTAIDVRGTRIAVANVGGKYYAFDDASRGVQHRSVGRQMMIH
jgi:nitrite reductase/ring-hydroxylating ferredoxin subunit